MWYSRVCNKSLDLTALFVHLQHTAYGTLWFMGRMGWFIASSITGSVINSRNELLIEIYSCHLSSIYGAPHRPTRHDVRRPNNESINFFLQWNLLIPLVPLLAWVDSLIYLNNNIVSHQLHVFITGFILKTTQRPQRTNCH